MSFENWKGEDLVLWGNALFVFVAFIVAATAVARELWKKS